MPFKFWLFLRFTYKLRTFRTSPNSGTVPIKLCRMTEEPKSTAGPNQPQAGFETTAQAYLELLSLRGIEYFFANAGTDFASIVDAFAYRQHQGDNFPRPITVPHETPLISMAHGYYMLTGKPQAAMVHVGVGTANGLGALMAAQRARVPILFSAGRTPLTESGSPASRNAYIHNEMTALLQ